MINIGAMIGLLPLKGITLPFISAGGTSLLFITAAVGLAFQVSRYTTLGVSTNSFQKEKGDRYDNFVDRRRVRGAYHPGLERR
jgi:cell division protein FtsW